MTTPGDRERKEFQALLHQFVEWKIELRAYEIYEMRGREDGHALDDWLRAEQQITERKTRTTAA